MINTKGIIINIKGIDIKIEYSVNNLHILGLRDRPFRAIENGLKSIEIRANTRQSPFDFNSIKPNDSIKLINETTGEELLTKVKSISKYNSARSFLEKVGLEHLSSKPKNIEQGVRSLESYTGYKEGIKKYGLFAIEIETIKN